MLRHSVNKILKTQTEYNDTLRRIEALIALDPEPGSPDAEMVDLLVLLANDYESRMLERRVVDPLEAIRFRMEQQNLAPRDLMPYIGTRSNVSEVLARKRPLTISMIRALHAGLGIPLKSLIQEPPIEVANTDPIPSDFPLRDMVKRGWLRDTEVARDPVAAIVNLLSPFKEQSLQVMFRKADHVRAIRTVNKHALLAWSARVMTLASEVSVVDYNREIVTSNFLREVVLLSTADDSPIRVKEFLRAHGIILIVEPHLPRTHLDGAAMTTPSGNPVVGLSVRYDRIDNFWFCLMHELAHVMLHLGTVDVPWFYDDLDADDRGDPLEREADELAGEILVPERAWRESPASGSLSPLAAEQLARKLKIHPAIVAGKMRHTFKSYRALNHLVGQGDVRRWFPEVDWS